MNRKKFSTEHLRKNLIEANILLFKDSKIQYILYF